MNDGVVSVCLLFVTVCIIHSQFTEEPSIPLWPKKNRIRMAKDQCILYSSQIPIPSTCTHAYLIMPFVLALVFAPPFYLIFRYRQSIKERLEEIEKGFFQFRVYREIKGTNDDTKRIRCLELNPAYVEEHRERWTLISLGEYLSQLRPGSEAPKFLKKELEIVIGSALIKYLGHSYGLALLPLLGQDSVDSYLSKMAASTASWVAASILSDKVEEDPSLDVGALKLSLPELISFININQSISSHHTEVSPMDMLSRGEGGNGNLSFDRSHSDEEEIERNDGLPNPFILERDFRNCIVAMEKHIFKLNGSFDPNDKNMADPTPVNERILPDLHFGWGDAKCTHTKRECLENRLVALLLTKLGYNFHLTANNEKEIFELMCNEKKCHYPEDFIAALIDSGHKVKVCPRATVAQFGISLCVKESDGLFSNIPLSFQLRTGVERTSDGSQAYFPAPHGGLDIGITGPLIGTSASCDMQFYVDIRGLTAVYENQNVDVPWLKRTSLADVYSEEQALCALRMMGLLSVVFNSIATDMKLPFGGYGVLGMCNDVATLIDVGIRKKTSAYPLLSTGRYLHHIVTYFVKLQNDLIAQPGMGAAVKDIDELIRAAVSMPSDLHISPGTIMSTAERFLTTYEEPIFQLTLGSREIMSEMISTYGKYSDRAS